MGALSNFLFLIYLADLFILTLQFIFYVLYSITCQSKTNIDTGSAEMFLCKAITVGSILTEVFFSFFLLTHARGSGGMEKERRRIGPSLS